MHNKIASVVLAFVALLLCSTAVGADPLRLVACAPGYPGNTDQAQPAMDDLAGGIEKQAGWKAGTLTAVYHAIEEAGAQAIAADRSALALVPLPFYLKHRDELALRPLLEVKQLSGDGEVWTLVARRGALSASAGLDGWEVSSLAGYAPRFVRDVALDGQAGLTATTRIEFGPRVISALRRSVSGEQVAVLLDRSQAEALPSLPFSGELEVIARSSPLVGNLLCAVGDGLTAEAGAGLTRSLPAMSESEAGRELLASVRIARFVPLDTELLAEIEARYAAGDDAR